MSSGLLAVCGGAMILLGTVFRLQGEAVLGPESSFMYSSPDWTGYGTYIAMAGLCVLAAGIAVRIRRR